MRLKPQGSCSNDRLNGHLPPPDGFVAIAVQLAMMAPAQRYRELVADLAPERPALGKAEMMGVTGTTAADETRLVRHVPYMLAVADSAELGQGKHGFIDPRGRAFVSRSNFVALTRGLVWLARCRCHHMVRECKSGES